MNTAERRRHPRFETKVEATLLTADRKVPATLIDIGEGGIGVISEKSILPGTEVYLSLNLKGKYVIQGTVVWSSQVYNDGKSQYRMGIEADRIIVPDIKAIGFLKRSQLVEEILSQIKQQGGKFIETV